MKKIPLVMKVWAGAEPHDMDYITRSIPSLLASTLPETFEVVIYDDCSPSADLKHFLQAVAKRDRRVRLIHGTENKGPNLGQQDIYSQVVGEYPAAPYYVNVDDDVIYHRDWMRQLLAARHNCQTLGLNGVFTALNMPYRSAHSVLSTRGRRYLLKWKQPALNWLIPRDLYEEVGPFRDEGIAYDTVYSHWMRLRQYSVVCLTPSYVQNIGLLGAYATDDTTTSRDFVGEGGGRSVLARGYDAARYTWRRLPDVLRRQMDDAAHQVAPIRWGTEFVHEGITRDGASVAMFSFEDAVRLGWDKNTAARRVREMQQTGVAGVVALRHNRAGLPVWVECDWAFSPNLRELGTLNLPQRIVAPETVFQALIRQLLPLHGQNVVHNKIRQDNVYLRDDDSPVRLAWLGTEPRPGVDWAGQGRPRTVEMLSGALNRWALPALREGCAARYLESQAPEVMRGEPPSPQSDLFAAAAVAALSISDPIHTLDQMEHVRGRWAAGDFSGWAALADTRTRSLMAQCLASSPQARPDDAQQVAHGLGL